MSKSSPVLWILWSQTKDLYFASLPPSFLPFISSIIFSELLTFVYAAYEIAYFHPFFSIFNILNPIFASVYCDKTLPYIILSYFEEVCTFSASLPRFSFTSLTHTAGFSHYHTNKLPVTSCVAKEHWQFCLFVFIYLPRALDTFPFIKLLSSLAWGNITFLLFFYLLWIFFLIQKYHSPLDFFLGSLLFSLCVILGDSTHDHVPWLQVTYLCSYSQLMSAKTQNQISVPTRRL